MSTSANVGSHCKLEAGDCLPQKNVNLLLDAIQYQYATWNPKKNKSYYLRRDLDRITRTHVVTPTASGASPGPNLYQNLAEDLDATESTFLWGGSLGEVQCVHLTNNIVVHHIPKGF